jgi:hypothetical protein
VRRRTARESTLFARRLMIHGEHSSGVVCRR